MGFLTEKQRHLGSGLGKPKGTERGSHSDLRSGLHSETEMGSASVTLMDSLRAKDLGSHSD